MLFAAGVRFQSTLPQGERHSTTLINPKSLLFQSTLPQGERRVADVKMPHYVKFQSTLPQGERLNGAVSVPCTRHISIHAPTRGATSSGGGLEDSNKLFQSTLPQGERHKIEQESSKAKQFQSTLPQGERPFVTTSVPSTEDFNPRSHKGSDRKQDLHHVHVNISIHAPTRGATKSPPFP